MVRHIVALETCTPESSSKASPCSSRVRSGLRSSWEGSHSESKAPFLAGGPGMGRGRTSPASCLIFSQRFMQGKETPKTRTTSLRSMPRSTASNTLSLRSFEYGFLPTSIYEAQPTRNPLSVPVQEIGAVHVLDAVQLGFGYGEEASLVVEMPVEEALLQLYVGVAVDILRAESPRR
jgi:hypothetical protein